ncbi:hypothetical protein GCM10027168_41010 [Streptomyces capparidis]
MAATSTSDDTRDDSTRDGAARAERRAARRAEKLARAARRFAAEHGGSAEGTLEYLGQRGTRIVLVAADGAWGDLIAPDQGTARRAAELAGITVRDALDGETAARLRTGPYEWKRMAGIQGPRKAEPYAPGGSG